VKHRRSAPVTLALATTLSLLALASSASAGPKDAHAEAERKKALDEDYLDTRFDDAAQRLRAAIQICGGDACSHATTAKLFVALGSVLAGGKKELSDASDAFVEALTLDPRAKIDPDLASSEVTFAFDQAKKRLGIGGAKADKKAPSGGTEKGAPVVEKDKPEPAVEKDRPDREKSEPERPPEPEPEKPLPVEAKRNWVTLAFSPDVAFVSGENVCTKATQESDHIFCTRQDATHYVGTPTVGNADNINTGAVLSTLRITLGYDRLLGERITVGARLGFAFNGASDGGASFLPVHAEARLGVWPGAAPFVGSGVRPFLFLAVGVAQIDSRVDVELLEDGKACVAKTPSDTGSQCTKPSRDGYLEPRKQTVSAYKQAGLGFAAGGVGVQIAPTPGIAFHLAVRGGITFPSVVPVITPEAGFALGF
jgi:hypothetical protein